MLSLACVGPDSDSAGRQYDVSLHEEDTLHIGRSSKLPHPRILFPDDKEMSSRHAQVSLKFRKSKRARSSSAGEGTAATPPTIIDCSAAWFKDLGSLNGAAARCARCSPLAACMRRFLASQAPFETASAFRRTASSSGVLAASFKLAKCNFGSGAWRTPVRPPSQSSCRQLQLPLKHLCRRPPLPLHEVHCTEPPARGASLTYHSRQVLRNPPSFPLLPAPAAWLPPPPRPAPCHGRASTVTAGCRTLLPPHPPFPLQPTLIPASVLSGLVRRCGIQRPLQCPAPWRQPPLQAKTAWTGSWKASRHQKARGGQLLNCPLPRSKRCRPTAATAMACLSAGPLTCGATRS